MLLFLTLNFATWYCALAIVCQSQSGIFLNVSIQMPQDGRLRLAVANAGDSRAVLGRKDQKR